MGKALAKVVEVDENSGFVRVKFNGFNPLVFTTIVPFDNGMRLRSILSMKSWLTIVTIVFVCHI